MYDKPNGDLQFFLTNTHYYRGIQMYVSVAENQTGAWFECDQWKYTKVENALLYVDKPHCTLLRKTEAQMLMDELWKCGVRPAEGQGSAGWLAAVQGHLADMRMITFNKLKISMGEKE